MGDKEKIEELYERIWQLEKEKMELEERNSKAIEWCEWFYADNKEFYKGKGIGLTLPEVDGLLKILKGENNENKN